MSAIRRLALAALLSLGSLPAWGEDAGITGAANVDVSGTPPGGGTSLLEVGRVVVRDEHIVSDAKGLAQLLFLDQTTLTVGPNSDIVIDEFVYDPATKDGALLMNASVGVFRLIGGEAATSGGITVGTPFATMGIRGSNVVIEISPNGRTRVTCNYCESVEIRLLNDPDNLVTIFGSDRFRTIEIGPDGFSAPFELTPEELAQLQDLLTSRPGQNGGVANIPVEPQVSQVVNGNNNSNVPPGENDPNNPPPVQNGYNDQNIGNPQEQTEGSQDQNEQKAEGDDDTGDAPAALLFTGGTFISGGGGLVTLAEGDDGWAGNLGDPGHTQSIESAELVGGQLVLTLAGGGVFSLPWQSGSFTFGGGASSPDGAISGAGFVSPSGEFFYYTVTEQESGASDFLFGGQQIDPGEHYSGIMAWDLQPDDLVGGDIPFLRPEMTAGMDPEDIVVSPLYFVSFDPEDEDEGVEYGRYGLAALGIQGTGASQTSVLMVAVLDEDVVYEGDPEPGLEGSISAFANQQDDTRILVGELASVPDGNQNAYFGGADGVFFVLGSGKWQSGNNSDVLYEYGTADGGEGSVAYEPLQAATPKAALPADLGAERVPIQHDGYAAGAADLGNGGGFVPLSGGLSLETLGEGGNYAEMYLDVNHGGSAESGFDSLYLQFGQGIYVDRARILMQGSYGVFDGEGGETDSASGAFVSYELVAQPGDILPGGATACACAFMEWGFWGFDAYAAGEPSTVATIPLGTWMAGEQSFDYADLPESGTASYEGHALANIVSTVDEVSASYLASGSLAIEVDFGSRDLTGSIGDLDGRDYAFSADYTGFDSEVPTFGAYGQSTDGEVDILLNGGFFAGPVSATQGIGGSFELQPNELSSIDYVGAGTFIGEQVPQ